MAKQTAYSANLEREGLGMALYHPLPFLENENEKRIGDIAYFDAQGIYKWIANAWDAKVIHLRYGESEFVAFARVGLARN